MSIQSDQDYIEKAKLEIQQLASLLLENVLLGGFESDYEMMLEHETEATCELDDSFEQRTQRLILLRGAGRRGHALIEAVQAFVDDVQKICKPESEVQS
jgi:hypothetical protein